MYERMQDDMDINCGTVLDGLQTMDELGLSIFKLILDTASGTASKSEKMEVGEEEFCPWPIGVLG